MNIVERFMHNGRKVTIYQDPDCSSPRENDNLAVLVCSHRRYDLGDVQRSDAPTEDELRAELTKAGEVVLAMLPLYFYDHSGQDMNTTGFSCRWDSGQVGWAYVTKASAEAMGCVGAYGGPEGGTWDEARLNAAIVSEVETYAAFLRGECYGYDVVGAEGDDIGSCWGFVGDLDYVHKEAIGEAEGDDPAVERAAEELASRATLAGAS